MNVKNRTLFIADNLDIMQGMDSETVDLIYLDPPAPPFNTNWNYEAPIGSAAEGAEFINIWTDEDFRSGWYTQIAEKYPHIHRFIQTTEHIYDNSMMIYLKKMSMRLIEMRRILKPTGSIYLHCDPTASHYLKILMDSVFVKNNYQSEVIWGYRTQDVSKPAWPKKHDVLLHFGKKGEPTFHPPTERTGYPTQQPLALLNSVIKASSNEGDVVLDPFCGCATACVAAEKLNRQWIGIDISPSAEDITKIRLEEASEQGNLFSPITMSDVIVIPFLLIILSLPVVRNETEDSTNWKFMLQ